MSDLVLYNYFRSSTSYRARIALHYKGLDFEYRPVHLLNNGGEQHFAEYKKISPLGEVPTLLHKGKALAQSMAIVEYLDDVFPQQRLFPADPFNKAKVRQFCESVNCGLHPLSNLKVMQYLEKKAGLNDQQKQQWLDEWLYRGLDALESLVSSHGGRHCFGNEITAADVFLVPQLFSARRFNIDVGRYKKLLAIEEICQQHPAFVKAHPFRQPDTPAENRLS